MLHTVSLLSLMQKLSATATIPLGLPGIGYINNTNTFGWTM